MNLKAFSIHSSEIWRVYLSTVRIQSIFDKINLYIDKENTWKIGYHARA